MNREDDGRVNAGIALFITLTFLGSWFMAATLRLAAAQARSRWPWQRRAWPLCSRVGACLASRRR
jgi:hypothetical protein